MDARNVMIGDWVLFQGREICVGNQLFDARYKDCIITPIPLTEEILKANGFFMYAGYMQYKQPYISLTWNTLTNYFHAFIELMGKRDMFIPINYVHELQHTLRLCGLTELADNFKLEG